MLKLWLIHKKSYRETSLITTVLTEEDQLARCISRGTRGVFSEFQPLFGLIKRNKRSSLATLNNVEITGSRLPLVGKELISALYVNEITSLLIPDGVKVDGLFLAYRDILASLSTQHLTHLRRYERFLLDASGIYPELKCDWLGHSLRSDRFYRLNQFENLVELESDNKDAMLGSDWKRLANSEYELPEIALHAKYLHRALIDRVTNGRRLVSRELIADLGTK